jgi:hypothetical protein
MTVALAGCAHDARPPRASGAPQVLYVWRNFEETGIPDELTIYGDGDLRYRYLLHTQRGIRIQTGRLGPEQLRAIRRLLARVDVRRADATHVEPRRDGYRWVLRRGGQVGTAADGHVHGALRTLLRRLGAVMDRLQASSL